MAEDTAVAVEMVRVLVVEPEVAVMEGVGVDMVGPVVVVCKITVLLAMDPADHPMATLRPNQ